MSIIADIGFYFYAYAPPNPCVIIAREAVGFEPTPIEDGKHNTAMTL
ncbi:hypothetical protein H1R20_g6083, partial [Candolleomyces eurysporus]